MAKLDLEKLIVKRKQIHNRKAYLIRKAKGVIGQREREKQEVSEKKKRAEDITKSDLMMFNKAIKAFRAGDEYKDLYDLLYCKYGIAASNAKTIIYRLFSEGFFAWIMYDPTQRDDELIMEVQKREL